MKYSIIMPFINRGEKLLHTLNSFHNLYQDRYDFEVIIIEDIKNTESLLGFVAEYSFPIRVIKSKLIDCFNPAPLFNIGAEEVEGEFLILTSSEILHAADILGGLDEEFADESFKYVICSCKNQGGRNNIPWYQHSEFRNKRYHFCSALPKFLFEAIGGFDNEYGKGIAYDDDDFLRTILETDAEIITRDDLETHHQWHPKITVKVPGYRSKLMRNKEYYESKWKESIAI